MPGPSSVIVADEHPIFRDGVVAAIESRPQLRLLGIAGDGIEALRRVRVSTPYVLVLDLDLPGLDGFGVPEAIAADEATRVLVVSALHAAATVYRAIRPGAHGYLASTRRPGSCATRLGDRARADDRRSVGRRAQPAWRALYTLALVRCDS